MATDSFLVTGGVKQELTITLAMLEKMKAVAIPDLKNLNHLGEPKNTVKGLKGILLKDILSKMEIDATSPRGYSAYYLTCIASDGYTIVYSWNELFNNPVGDHVFIITEMDGKSLRQMDDHIVMLNDSDLKTGRRHLKALAKIKVSLAASE